MKCIFCNNKNTSVKNSRSVKSGLQVWRRRHCDSCGKTFTTTETGLINNLFVRKRNKTKQRFTYEKLFVSIFSALHTKHRNDHGDNAKLAKEISEQIVVDVLRSCPKGNIITSTELTLSVYKQLRKHGPLYADHYKFYSETRLRTISELLSKK
jgi:transcriptional regulator NrdR family protein